MFDGGALAYYTHPDDRRNAVECSVCEEVPRYLPKECACTDKPHRVCRECLIPCLGCNTPMCPEMTISCGMCGAYICTWCDVGPSDKSLCPGCYIAYTCTGCDGRVIGTVTRKCLGCDRPTTTCPEHAGGPCRLCGCRCQTCGAVFARLAHGVDVRSDPPSDGVNCWPVNSACPTCQRAARAWRRLETRDALVQWTPLNAELAEHVAVGMYCDPGPRSHPTFPETTREQVAAVLEDLLQRIQ
jgi:hypothetical protein